MFVLLRRTARHLSAFREATSGNVAMIFALSLIPLIGIAGAAVDYSRGNSAKADMQAALDATALNLAKNPTVPSMTGAQLQASAQTIFTALFNRPEVQNITV